MKIKGKSVLGSGMFIQRNRRVEIESISRFSARYAARNKTSRIFAISPGWNVVPATESQSLAPFISLPTTAGRMRRRIPPSTVVYL